MRKFKCGVSIFLAICICVTSSSLAWAVKPKDIKDKPPEPSMDEALVVQEHKDVSEGLSPEEKKVKIIDKYPPDFSNMQRIEVPWAKGEVICPDAHYIDKDGREKFVLYNNHFHQLKKMKTMALTNTIEEQYWFRRLPSKGTLLENGENYEYSRWNLPAILCFFAANKQSREMSNSCRELSRLVQTYGKEINPDKIGAIVVDRESGECVVSSTPIKRYKNVEEGFYRIVNSDMDVCRVAEAISQCVDEFERIINPRASDEQRVDFCFALDRACYYLNRLDVSLQDEDLQTVEELNSLRKKLNRLLLRYRFIHKTDVSPILGVKIDRCKIIDQSRDHTLLFLNCSEMKKFEKTLSRMLDNKAMNITRKYSMSEFTAKELRDLAESIDPDSCQDIIDHINHQIIDMKANADKERDHFRVEMLKVGLDVAKSGAEIILTTMAGGSPSLSESAQVPVRTNFTQKQIEDYLTVEKSCKQSTNTVDPEALNQFLSGDFSNPNEMSASQTVSVPKYSQGTGIEQVGFSQHFGQVRTVENNTDVAQAFRKFNLTPEQIDGISRGFESYVESNRITEHVKIHEKRCARLVEKQEYLIDFVNMVKLHIKIEKELLEAKEGLEGFLIEEKKNGALTEYMAEGIA